jgi:hypothetical protein
MNIVDTQKQKSITFIIFLNSDLYSQDIWAQIKPNLDFVFTQLDIVHKNVALGGVVVSVLATGPKVRGFKPGRGRWILR